MVNRAFLVAVVLAATGVASPSPAQENVWAFGLAYEIMSPFCPGRTLADCPSDQATQLRLWIAQQELDGRTQDEVVAELISRYGEDVRARPEAKGLGLAAYLIPVVALLLGGGGIAWYLRRQVREVESEPIQSDAAPDPEFLRRVDEELRERAR